MKLEEFAIDDLHQMATAELVHDPQTVVDLHRLYSHLRQQYIEAFRAKRRSTPLYFQSDEEATC
jgi:hypothetical protein